MKKLWTVEVSRTEATTILVYADDVKEAVKVAKDNADQALEDLYLGAEVDAKHATEVNQFWDFDQSKSTAVRLRANYSALPKSMEDELPYGSGMDDDSVDDEGDELNAKQILERLIAERVEREARAAEEAKQGKLFGGGA